MKIHDSITKERIMEAIEADEYAGFCAVCGEEAESVEPDARGYYCDICNEMGVYGSEELLMMIA